MRIATEQLDRLGDEEFADELKEALWNDQDWKSFDQPEMVDRTLEVLAALRTAISAQLSLHQDNEEWRGRAKRYLAQADVRYSQTKRSIRHYNRLETASMTAFEQKWSGLAYDLAVALEGSTEDHKLDEITVHDELTAREWLTARRARRLAKGKEI